MSDAVNQPNAATDAALRESEQRYRLIVDSMDDGFCIVEMIYDDAGKPIDYRFLEVNPAFEQQTGIVGAVGRRRREIALQHDDHWFEIYGKVAETGEPVRFEHAAVALGRIYDVYAFRFGTAAQRRVAILFRDIGERRRTESALKLSEQRYRLLVENIRDYAVFTIDLNGGVTSWNPGARRTFAYEDGEIIGQNARILFTPEDQAAGESEKELATAAAQGRASDDRWQMRKDGSRFWASGVTTGMFDDGGQLVGFTKVCRDLTGQKLLDEQRERLLKQEQAARAEAERAITMKDEFIAIVSHELRTPLATILLWAKLLRGGGLPPNHITQALSAIEQSAVAQQQLIEDLLDISRITSGKLRLQVREIDLVGIIDAAKETVLPMAQSKAVMLTVAIDRTPVMINADPDRLQQVLWNLLNNAVKFTDRGGLVALTLTLHPDTVAVIVTDTGQGIEADFLPYVFERFRQADATTTRKQGGLGLGLAITRQIVELHGGQVSVNSAGLGRGATFTVVLPLSKQFTGAAARSKRHVEQVVQQFVPEPVLSGVRVLLVEDEAATRSAIEYVLRQAAATVTAVDSARKCFQTFVDALDRQRFDVVVSDLAMPDQDGFALIQQLRDTERQRNVGRTPALALSAYARAEDRRRALAAGFDEHLAKPVDPISLVNGIARLIENAK